MASEIKVDTISEKTSTSGVTIDSLGIKDGKITNLMNATLSAADLGVGLHIKTADSSAATHTSADELVLENAGHCGISILSATDGTGNIYFNDSGGVARGYFEYNHDTDKLSVGTAGANGLVIDSTGAVTKPLQPCFSVVPASQQSNVSTGTQIAFGTELFDLNGDFASNTFTAPVTGKYFLGHSLRLQEVDADYTYFMVQITTSNRAYYHIQDTGTYDEDAAYMEWTNGVVADMDANDTCDLAVAFVGGANQVDISTNSFFYGYLIC